MISVGRLAACAVAIATSLAAQTDPAPADGSATPRNIIVIMADDLGPWAMGAYGNAEVVTPNLDALARQGARFTNAFSVSGVCTPCRMSFLTGLYPTQVGVLTDTGRDSSRCEGLPPGVITWPEVLQHRGYATGLIGKWHLGTLKQYAPRQHGYDYFFGYLLGSSEPVDPWLVRDDETYERTQVKGFHGDILATDALQFIRRNREHPFALSLNFREPHTPHLPMPQVDLDAVKGVHPAGVTEDLANKRREYYAAIHGLDRRIGRVLRCLEETGLAERTIVLFTSDQGLMLGQRGGLIGKGEAFAEGSRNMPDADDLSVVNLWDLTIRVPLLVRWPGVVAPGTEIDDLVSHIDVFASILGMLSVPLPADYPQQGSDFTPLLRGEKVPWREVLFAQYDSDQIGNFELLRVARTKHMKLVRAFLNPGGNRLYDLDHDPEELTNLYYAKPGEKLNPSLLELGVALHTWQLAIDDPALAAERAYTDARRAARGHWKEPNILEMSTGK